MLKLVFNNQNLGTMNSKIKSLVETSPEVRNFEFRDATELEIWLPAIRVEGLLTGYFANYLGDSDGMFIVLDCEPDKIYRICDLEALDTLKACLDDVEVLVDVDWLEYSLGSTAEWRPVDGTEDWVVVEDPWKFVYEYSEKMTALDYKETQNWAAQRDYDNWKAEVAYDLCLDDFFYWDGYRNEVFKVNAPVTVVALDEGLAKYRSDAYLVLKGDHTERIAAEEEKYGTASGNRSVMKFIDKPGYVWFAPEFERIEYIGADKKEALKNLIIAGNNPREESIPALQNLGVLVKVQNSDALFENLNSIICYESSVVYFVEGTEPLSGIEADIEDFMYRLASDTGDSVGVKVRVKGRLVIVTWSLEIL